MKLFEVVALGVAGVCGAGLSAAGELEIAFDNPQQGITVRNPGPPVVPDVYIVAQPDRSAQPVRKLKGVSLCGVRLAETMLSESVLILRGDGTGNWGYHTGFDIFREPQFDCGKPIDPRTLVEYDKWRYDPEGPVVVSGGDMNMLWLVNRRPLAPAVYQIAFVPLVRIRSLRVSSNCDQIGTPGVAVHVGLFADAACTQPIARQSVGPNQKVERFPVRFEGLDTSAVWLRLSAEGPENAAVGLYYTMFEAELDASRLQLPELKTGDNLWTIASDAEGSHRGRVVLRWVERPPAERIWEDFEGPLRWSGCEQVGDEASRRAAFTGWRRVRVKVPADGRDCAISRSVDRQDLSRYNRLGVAVRVLRQVPVRGVLFGIQNDGGGNQYVHLRPTEPWSFQAFDIGHFQRDRVASMTVYWLGMPGLDRPGEEGVYELDTIALWRDDAPPPSPPSLPEKIAKYRSPLAGRSAPQRPLPPIQEWFPMGVYDGLCSRSTQECEWLLDQMARFHMDAVYISNGDLDGLERVLPLAEARGIRLIYQGTSDGALYYLHLPTAEARRESLQRVILPRVREAIPRFAGRWGLAAWSLTEEIGPELVPELAPFYALVRQLDPAHPPTVLHNNLQAAIADLQTNRPEVVTHDFYPFFWAPRSGPSNPARSLAAYRQHVASYYRACRQHGASLWMMPQAWGADESAPLDPPHYGYRVGMRTPQPGEIKLQGWVAVAEGATGLMFYAAVASQPEQHHVWDYGFTETANTRAAGELFGRLKRVAPLLCRLERDYAEEGFVKSSNPRVLAHSFTRRAAYAGSGRYVVVASLDGFGPQSFDLGLTGQGRVFDLIAREEITARLSARTLEAGEGMVLLVGTVDDFQRDCRLLDEQPGTLP